MIEKTFFVNHTRKFIVPTELDVAFNITKNLREAFHRSQWTIDDHIELVHSDNIPHTRGVQLLVVYKYDLSSWLEDLKYFIAEGSPEWKAVTLCDYSLPGPCGV